MISIASFRKQKKAIVTSKDWKYDHLQDESRQNRASAHARKNKNISFRLGETLIKKGRRK